MENTVDIRKYAPFFHDGILFNIAHCEDGISLNMCSAELNLEDVESEIELSRSHAITGILHFSGIKNIQISGEISLDHFFKLYDAGTILDFDFIDHSVELGILWQNRPPKQRTNEFSTIRIKADHIWWENIPGLAT